MRYLHVISAFAAEPWAMQPEKLEAIASFLAFKARGGMLTAEEVQARTGFAEREQAPPQQSGVAVLPMHGVISQRVNMLDNISSGGGTSTEAMAEMFRAALADDAIKAIVIDGDSPGGGTYGVDELASEIRAARGIKPIVAQVNSLMASAAYYIGSQADEVVITPGGEVGSIGVYAVHEDISKMLEKEGVNPTLIRGKNGVYKAETSAYGPLSTDAKGYLQDRVNRAEDAFIKAVASGRRVSQSTVRQDFGKGRMFGADAAVKAGLADRVGTMQETLQRLGVSSPRVGAGAASRQAFAAGDTPNPSQIEDLLREAGFPKALATQFVSRGKGVLRSETEPAETNPLNPEAKASLNALMAKLSGNGDAK